MGYHISNQNHNDPNQNQNHIYPNTDNIWIWVVNQTNIIFNYPKPNPFFATPK